MLQVLLHNESEVSSDEKDILILFLDALYAPKVPIEQNSFSLGRQVESTFSPTIAFCPKQTMFWHHKNMKNAFVWRVVLIIMQNSIIIKIDT